MTKTRKMYNVRLLGRRAMCPICNGMLIFLDEETGYRCNDCGARLIPTGKGITDRELECRIMEGDYAKNTM